MDKGHRQADKILADITDEMLKVFEKADRKIIKKVRNYLKKFEAEIKEREQMVDDGEMTRKEIKMKKTVAAILLLCLTVLLFACSENGNQITKQVDSFFHQTITPNKHKKPRRPKGILPKSPDPLKNLPWHRKKIESVIRSGMKKGKSIDDIARRLHKVTNMDRVAAYRAARTGVTCAENEARIDAMLDAQDMGIPYDKIWFATLDDRTRVAHRVMHGERVPCDAYFSNDMYEPGDPAGAPEELYNCRCALLWVPAGMPMDIEEGPDGMGKLEWSAQKPVSKPYPRWRDG